MKKDVPRSAEGLEIPSGSGNGISNHECPYPNNVTIDEQEEAHNLPEAPNNAVTDVPEETHDSAEGHSNGASLPYNPLLDLLSLTKKALRFKKKKKKKTPELEVARKTGDVDDSVDTETHDLGLSYLHRFEETNQSTDISVAIEYLQQAVFLTPDPHARLPGRLHDLGYSLLCRFYQEGQVSDISDAIQHLHKAVILTSYDDCCMPRRLYNLGRSYLERYNRLDVLAVFSQFIEHLQRTVSLTPEDNSTMPSHLTDLASSPMGRFDRVDVLADITASVEYLQKAVLLTPEGHANLRVRLKTLGLAYLHRVERVDDFDDICNAIKYSRKAVSLSLDGCHDDSPLYLNHLVLSLIGRFKRTGSLADISEAIESQQQAVLLAPEGHPDLPMQLNDLAKFFMHRFDKVSDIADISSAIEHQKKAVFLIPTGHTNMPVFANNLGQMLMRRFQRGGDLADISEAINFHQQVVVLTPEGHASMSLRLNNLGLVFLARFNRSGNIPDISNAIEHLQRAAMLSCEGHINLPGILNNLGHALLCRFDRMGDIVDVSDAIQYQQKAVFYTPEGHSDLPMRLNNIGLSLLLRFERSRNVSDLSDAIEHLQKAVLLTHEGHPRIPALLNNLGHSFARRFYSTDNPSDCMAAVEHHRRAVLLTHEGHADLPMRLSNFGSMLMCRFELLGESVDIPDAILNLERAVRLTPAGHADMPKRLNNLGHALLISFKQGNNLADANNAIKHLQKAVQLTPEGHANIPLWLNVLGETFYRRFEQTTLVADCQAASLNFRLAATHSSGCPNTRLHCARKWAICSVAKKDLAESLQAYDMTIELMSVVASIDQTIQNRHSNLASISDLAAEAVFLALSTGNANKALEWLEQSRCLVWTQINRLRTPVDMLKTRIASLANHFLDVSKALESTGARSNTTECPAGTARLLTDQIKLHEQAHTHAKLAREWSHLLDQIRNIPNFQDFLRPPKAAELLSQLPSNGPVVIIHIYGEHCNALALIHGADEVLHIPITKFDYKKAEDLRKHLCKHLVSINLRERDDRAIKRRVKNIERSNPLRWILHELWDSVVSPILQVTASSCESKPYRWCPTGPLAFLPIHAAGIYGEEVVNRGSCLSDFAVSSYIPTVSALLEKVKISTKVKQPLTKILLISQPNTPGLSPIPATAAETQATMKKAHDNGLEAMLLEAAEATTARVKAEMSSHGWVHFACHASQDTADPLRSGFFLHDGRLELLEIARQHLPNADFAFLSACQTSVGEEKLSEEAVHIAAGMLAAGYRGVVATMWSIKDAFAPQIAEDFYANLLETRMTSDERTLDSRHAAYALDDATQRLRDKLGYGEEALLTWVPYVHFGL